MEINIINDSSTQLIIDRKQYSEDVVHKCFYWYGDKYSVNINTSGDHFIIEISELSNEGTIANLLPKIKNDLIDFKTREIISHETKNIKEILIAKAFAFDDDLDEPPPGNINDPIGFDPSTI